MLFWPTGVGSSPFPAADKVVHFALFALLALTSRWRFGSSWPVLAVVAAYAGASEVVQALALDDRSGDAVDVIADVVGAGVGWAAARRLPR